MGDWKKEYGKSHLDVGDYLEYARRNISNLLTEKNNRIINELEKINGGRFKNEDEAIDFYDKRCALEVKPINHTTDRTTLYVDGEKVKVWNEIFKHLK